MTSRQIEKDLLRTLPTNVCYSNLNSTGIPRLRRILRGLAWLYPDIGYCQVCKEMMWKYNKKKELLLFNYAK